MKIYLAGPDVFKIDAIEYGKKLVELCKANGFEGLYLLDNTIANFQNNKETANKIFHANVDMIKDCDIILANMDNFRGPSMDAGTAWEMGMAFALNKKVISYNCSDLTLKQKTTLEHIDESPKYPIVDDFGLTDNLMLTECCSDMFESLEEAIEYIKELYV